MFNIKILCVEDEAIFRSVLSEILEDITTEVIFGENGQQGLNLFLEHSPEIVITDIALPHMTGLQMLREIKKVQPEILTIVTTSYSETEYFMEAIELGVNRFILKPFEKKQFQDILIQYIKSLNGEKQLKEEEAKRQIAEKALINSELLFRTLFSHAPQAIFLLNPVDHRIVEANEPAESLLGFSRNEILMLSQYDLVEKDIVDKHSALYEKLLKEGSNEAIRSEVKLRRKDGSFIDTQVSEKIVQFSDKSLVIGIFTDLTEQKKNQKKLEQYQEELELQVHQKTTELREANQKLKQELAAKVIAEAEKQRRSDFEALMLSVSTEFLVNKPEKVKDTIQASLERICHATQAGKAFVWIVDSNDEIVENLHFIADPGYVDVSNAEQIFNINELPLLKNSLKEGTHCIYSTSSIENKKSKEYKYLSSNFISSAVFCPFHPGITFRGVVGLASFADNVDFDSDTVFLLTMASQIFNVAFLRYETAIALINSEEKAHALLNASNASMILLNKVGTMLEINESASDIFGMPSERLVGKNYFEQHPHAVSEKRRPVINQVFETKSKTTFRDSYLLSSYEHLIYPVFNQDNEVDRIALMTRDITSYVDTQNQIRNQYNFMQALINGLPNPVYFKNADGVFLGCNKEFLTATGKARQEIIGKKRIFEHQNEFDDALSLFEDDTLDNSDMITYESVLHFADGKAYTIFFTKSAFFDLGGWKSGTIGTLTDVTNLKRFEFELKELNFNLETRVLEQFRSTEKQRNKLIQKSKLESLGQLAAGMAHEINQPLGGISMSLENILMKHHKNNLAGEYLTSKIDQCYENINRIKQIIDHIRTFSRDQQNSIIERVDMLEAVSNTLLLVETQYKNHQIKLEVIKPSHPLYFMGNKYKLEQVILNLLSNAKDAVEDQAKRNSKGSVEKHVTIECSLLKDQICLKVKDNGIGISPEKIDLLFEPFYTTKETNKGTGLGLSIVYGIIKEFNGSINIESEPGVGTEIEILLPIKN